MKNIEKNLFSNNSAINSAIKAILSHFSIRSQKRMKKAILNAKKAAEKHNDENTDAGARHKFREFIPASILNQNGFNFEYEKSINGKIPDWSDNDFGLIMESYTYERGGVSRFSDRVISVITNKCNKYSEIIRANSLNFIIAVYIDFLTFILLDECREEIELYRQVFTDNDFLSAIIFFQESQVINNKQQYAFFCITGNSTIKNYPNWPFNDIAVL